MASSSLEIFSEKEFAIFSKKHVDKVVGHIEVWPQNHEYWDFPGGAVVKNLPAGDVGSSPGPGRSHIPHAAEQLSPCATTTEPVL